MSCRVGTSPLLVVRQTQAIWHYRYERTIRTLPFSWLARSPAVELESLASRGITVIFGHCDPDARGRAVSEKASPATRIVRTEHGWHIDSQNQYFLPYGVTPEEAADFRIMVREMTVLDHDTRPRTQTEETPTVVTRPTPTPYAMVRILGSVEGACEWVD